MDFSWAWWIWWALGLLLVADFCDPSGVSARFWIGVPGVSLRSTPGSNLASLRLASKRGVVVNPERCTE